MYVAECYKIKHKHDDREAIKNVHNVYIKYLISRHTAGKAKNDIANTLKQDATIFPSHVCGTMSP